MITEVELHKKVRDAIFLSALGNWEESCSFDELSDDGKQVYEDYATAALEVYGEEIAKLRAEVSRIADEITAAVRRATAMEHAGALAIAALRGVSDSDVLTAEQHEPVAEALLAMFEAKSHWKTPKSGDAA